MSGEISSAAAPMQRSELFVRAIPAEVTQDELAAFFSEFAPVRHAVIVRDSQTGESRGFGFVTFSTPEDASAALNAAPNTPIRGRKLNLDFAKPRQRQDKSAASELDPAQNKERRRPRLIVRNCPWSLRNPQELVTLFSKFGKVVNAYIPRGANRRMSGFAFVTMRRKRHAKRAVEESKNLEIHGRPVAVDFALQKNKWESGVRDISDNESSDEESTDESDSDGETDSQDVRKSKSTGEGSDNSEDSDSAGNAEDVSGDSDDAEDALSGHLDGLLSDSESEVNGSHDGSDGEDEDEDEDEVEDEDADEASNEDNQSTQSSSRPRRRGLGEDHTVFVRNVPYDATAESLADHFAQFGPVAYALPVMDKQLNQPRGTAFVAFRNVEDCRKCIVGAPPVSSGSLLVPDDTDPRYVYEGRVLSVAQAVGRERANTLTETRAAERSGKDQRGDKRKLFLLNEGRVMPGSRLADVLSASDMQIRERSFELRRKQLQQNPSLHLSMTRLAIRNLPRAMNDRGLKALGRKAVVEFAREVSAKERQPLSKEEILRSSHYEESLPNKPNRKQGVVRQAKVVQEIKGSGSAGRSRGYGFLELRNHRAAVMALRWLNAHLVTKEEVAVGYNDPSEIPPLEGKRRLVVEFAIENAQVVKRHQDRQTRARETAKKRKAGEIEAEEHEAIARKEAAAHEAVEKPRGNNFVGRKRKAKKMKRR